MITPDTSSVQPPPPNERPPNGKFEAFDWAGQLSIEMVREHTKTDDVPGVSDEMLRLYRAAAIEAAEFYTGALLAGKKTLTEIVHLPKNWYRPYHRHQFRYQISDDGFAYLFGRSINIPLPVTSGQQSIRIPNVSHIPDFSNCCDPCASASNDMRIMYKAGYSSPDQVPAGIVMGCLQFIAWMVEHPGDELLAMRNKLDASAGAVKGQSNVALISGALEQWRQYDPEAI
jgi:hypothetical protein